MSEIKNYHAHVYFTEDSVEEARKLCKKASALFSLSMGKMHHKEVGPHSQWSCQLAFTAEKFGEVVPWLATHRSGLVILIHPQTGDVVKDHTSHAIWLGPSIPLDLVALTSTQD